MNEFLAEIYNTRETIGASSGGSDVEKLAEAQLLDDALRNEGIDVNTLSGDQIVKVAHHLFGDNSEIVKMAQEEGHEESETPAEEAKEEAAKAKQDSKVLPSQADTAGGTSADISSQGRRRKNVAHTKTPKKVGLYIPTHALEAFFSKW